MEITKHSKYAVIFDLDASTLYSEIDKSHCFPVVRRNGGNHRNCPFRAGILTAQSNVSFLRPLSLHVKQHVLHWVQIPTGRGTFGLVGPLKSTVVAYKIDQPAYILTFLCDSSVNAINSQADWLLSQSQCCDWFISICI